MYLYLAIRPNLLSGITCIWLSDKFYYLELSVSGNFYYPCIPTCNALEMILLGSAILVENISSDLHIQNYVF